MILLLALFLNFTSMVTANQASEITFAGDFDSNPKLKEILTHDLELLETFKLQESPTDLKKETFGSEDATYGAWFGKHVRTITYDSKPARILAKYQPSRKITLTPNYFIQPELTRLMLLVHEAKHDDRVHHGLCIGGRSESLDLKWYRIGCDRAAHRSHGASAVFLLDAGSQKPGSLTRIDKLWFNLSLNRIRNESEREKVISYKAQLGL